MVVDANSLKHSLHIILPKLGLVLKSLFEEEQKKRPDAIPYLRLLQEMPGDPDTQKATLMGALAILHGMGLIHVDASGRVKGVSRHARFALGSLGKFLSASVPAADERVGDKERDYLVSLTKVLESARVENAHVDKGSLHSRRIVNVLVKSHQIRHWKAQDVYLHVYHRQWKEYHLVGLSHKDDSRSDEEIAHMAVQRQVGLMPDQYVLDPTFNPLEVTDRRISATSGALTEYTCALKAVKEVRIKLRLRELIEKGMYDPNWFRWFTWEEIKRRKGEQGEPIMFSLATLMTQEELSAIPIRAANADDVRRSADSINVFSYLSCRVTKKQLLSLAGILLALALLIQFVPRGVTALGHSHPLLDNLGNIADIVSGLLTLGGALSGGASIALHRKS